MGYHLIDAFAMICLSLPRGDVQAIMASVLWVVYGGFHYLYNNLSGHLAAYKHYYVYDMKVKASLPFSNHIRVIVILHNELSLCHNMPCKYRTKPRKKP